MGRPHLFLILYLERVERGRKRKTWKKKARRRKQERRERRGSSHNLFILKG